MPGGPKSASWRQPVSHHHKLQRPGHLLVGQAPFSGQANRGDSARAQVATPSARLQLSLGHSCTGKTCCGSILAGNSAIGLLVAPDNRRIAGLEVAFQDRLRPPQFRGMTSSTTGHHSARLHRHRCGRKVARKTCSPFAQRSIQLNVLNVAHLNGAPVGLHKKLWCQRCRPLVAVIASGSRQTTWRPRQTSANPSEVGTAPSLRRPPHRFRSALRVRAVGLAAILTSYLQAVVDVPAPPSR